MKWRLFCTLLLAITLVFNGFAQVVTVDPEFPTESDAVTIYFHADEGNQGLMDYDGDIYAHTGVITDQSTSSSNWRYVISEWNVNTDKAKLTKISTNLYSLDIQPSIKDFYGVPDGEVILQMAFVFRNSDGSVTGREDGGGDIFANVYESGLNLNITSPTDDYIIQSGESVTIEASSNEADSLFLFIDGISVDTVKALNLTYVHTENVAGLHKIKVTAKNSTERISDSVNFYVRGTIPEAELPDGWVKGINYLDDDSVGLVLFAPNKEFVFVLGDFTNWSLNDDYMMNRTPDGEYYWISIGGLTTQQEYIFQYFIDGDIKIADPYTEKTSDPNDGYIDEETYPGLIDYPDGKTTGIASVLQTGQETYQWHNNDFIPPGKENLIIYELLVRDFLAAHDYKTLIDTLDYLDSLGVNAIELMPVNEFEGNESWGYNPSFYFAPDKYYGPKEDLKAFVDSCHGRGIAVIMDMVLNHSYGQSPLVSMYFDPNAGDYGQPSAENPWYNQTSPNPTYSWGYDFNHESDYTKAFVDSVNSYWLENYKVDGFRFDFTKGFTNTPGDGSAYDAARITILERMADKIWEVNSSAYIILEHFAANSEEIELSDYGMMIWGNINYEYSQATKGLDSDISWGSYLERSWNSPLLVSYMESHDEERLMYENLTSGNSYGSYDITELKTALQRIELAANFFIPIPGPKMIWQFGELGYDVSINQDCRVCNKPILWNYYSNDDRLRLYKVYKALNKLKTNYDVFTTSNFSISQDGKAKTINLNGTEMNVVIMGNFDVTSLFVSATFPSTGDWYEFYSGDTLSVNHVQQSIIFNAGEYRLYTDVKLENPGIYIPTAIGPVEPDTEKISVYPNPSSDKVYFDLKQDLTDGGELYLFDIQGRQMVNEKIDTGQTKAELDISKYKNGIYFYRLVIKDKSYTGKLLKK